MAGQHVSLYRGGEAYDRKRTIIEATTAADGKAMIRFEKSGVHLLETRYPGPAAPGAAPETWTYTLSFEVTE